MPAKKPLMRENISSRPTDKYGNRATDADLGIGPGADARRRAAALKITAQEGTTSAAGGRPNKPAMPKSAEAALLRAGSVKPVKQTLPNKPNKPAVKQTLPNKPNKPAVKQNLVIRTTTNMKSSPMTKKR